MLSLSLCHFDRKVSVTCPRPCGLVAPGCEPRQRGSGVPLNPSSMLPCNTRNLCKRPVERFKWRLRQGRWLDGQRLNWSRIEKKLEPTLGLENKTLPEVLRQCRIALLGTSREIPDFLVKVNKAVGKMGVNFLCGDQPAPSSIAKNAKHYCCSLHFCCNWFLKWVNFWEPILKQCTRKNKFAGDWRAVRSQGRAVQRQGQARSTKSAHGQRDAERKTGQLWKNSTGSQFWLSFWL